jgi:pyridoxamine 5'-phosphate oxidase
MPLSPDELAALRRDYSLRPLHREELDPDPIVQFQHWLAEAHQQQVLEPNAMIIGTVDADSQPWTRTVLLKVCDERGFTFFTNYAGHKAQQLAANSRAALTFWWGPLERQVNIAGIVEKCSREESDLYFHSRPVSSQLGAWASEQSQVVPDREQLERQFEEARERFGEVNVPLPTNWGGYIVIPHTIEFWQGQRSRLHDRFRYTRLEGKWLIDRLSP